MKRLNSSSPRLENRAKLKRQIENFGKCEQINGKVQGNALFESNMKSMQAFFY